MNSALTAGSLAQAILKLIEPSSCWSTALPSGKQDIGSSPHGSRGCRQAGSLSDQGRAYVEVLDGRAKNEAAFPRRRRTPQEDIATPVQRAPLHDIDQDSFFQTLHARRTHRTVCEQAKYLWAAFQSCSKTTWDQDISRRSIRKLPYKTSPRVAQGTDRGLSDGAEVDGARGGNVSLPGRTTCWKNSR